MLLKRSISSLLLLVLFSSLMPLKARAIETQPRRYYKNETWKSRWKWNLLISGVVFSGITAVYANSKQNYVKAKSKLSLDKDKKAIQEDIKNQETIISLAGALAIFSFAGSLYLFVTDEAGVQSSLRKTPEVENHSRKIATGWNYSF